MASDEPVVPQDAAPTEVPPPPLPVVDPLPEARPALSAAPEVIRRHAAITRITHWINVVCITVLLMSGFQIFDAHPALYWGQKGAEAKTYNVLQKFSYIGIVILLPLMLATGLTMSPGMNAALPWLLDLFGGRQSDRTLHFVSAWLIVGFVIIHLIAVVAAGPINEIGSMITGRYRVEPEEDA